MDFFTFNFCFLEKLDIAPAPSVIISVFLQRHLWWVSKDASTYHLIVFSLSDRRMSFIHIFPFRYFMQLFNSPQLSFPVNFNLVVMKATGVWISLRDWLNKIIVAPPYYETLPIYPMVMVWHNCHPSLLISGILMDFLQWI